MNIIKYIQIKYTNIMLRKSYNQHDVQVLSNTQECVLMMVMSQGMGIT